MRSLSPTWSPAALAAAKARGVQLGNRNLPAMNRQAALARAEALRPVLTELCARGVGTLQAIADELNARFITTASGASWSPMQVHRVLRRLDLG